MQVIKFVADKPLKVLQTKPSSSCGLKENNCEKHSIRRQTSPVAADKVLSALQKLGISAIWGSVLNAVREERPWCPESIAYSELQRGVTQNRHILKANAHRIEACSYGVVTSQHIPCICAYSANSVQLGLKHVSLCSGQNSGTKLPSENCCPCMVPASA